MRRPRLSVEYVYTQQHCQGNISRKKGPEVNILPDLLLNRRTHYFLRAKGITCMCGKPLVRLCVNANLYTIRWRMIIA
ncbi:hypothetical protein [Chitinophaga agri]|uniref:Uncharacterized protein n=1 Tax=Chitinophaga agri TaxID=2703787 RepID=A0A6B9ZPC9_9BACT|nr:hypothetical protein [Chitinophaga agri]QHS63857.1 hypothetical protein GWR21_31035 [Chitinophaga agri]